MQSDKISVDLDINQVKKFYGSNLVLDNISLSVEGGSMVTLLGPSGCGKSTLLRIIAGFVSADAGQILLNKQSIGHLPPNLRETAMVFQDYTLFPHMSVLDNVKFGLKMRKITGPDADKQAKEALSMVQLEHLVDRLPSQLSGGQMQRVALARAIVTKPKLLLLDEPFAALDKNLREDMQVELRKLQQMLELTMVCVTHDQREAMVISDYVSVMSGGKIVQLGTPLEIYDTPKNIFTAQFIGGSNIFTATKVESDANGCLLELSQGQKVVSKTNNNIAVGKKVKLAVKPRSFWIATDQDNTENTNKVFISGTVSNVVMLGSSLAYEIDLTDGQKINIEVERSVNNLVTQAGSTIRIGANSDSFILLEDDENV